MKKKSFIVIVILLIAIILGLCAYIAYDKNLFGIKGEKKETNNTVEKKEDTNTTREVEVKNDYEYVGLAFSGIRLYDWPSNILEKGTNEPDKLAVKADVPKILIDTDVTKNINSKIYKQCEPIINEVKDSSSRDNVTAKNSAVESSVDYEYTILNDILFIEVNVLSVNHRASGGFDRKIYYYDIKNDKELSIEDVVDLLNIQVLDLNDESAESIDSIMPQTSSKMVKIYYRQYGKCPGIDCINEKIIGLK